MIVHLNGLVVNLGPLISTPIKSLPLEAWLPYSLENKFLFIVSYVYEVVAIIMSINISVGIECLALTTMLQLCGQLKINMHRLNLISQLTEIENAKPVVHDEEKELTKHCIKHHIFIYS